MAWVRCPECGSSETKVEETVADAAPAEPVQYRHHSCLARKGDGAPCGCYWHTAEKLIDVRPEKRWIWRLLGTRRVVSVGRAG